MTKKLDRNLTKWESDIIEGNVIYRYRNINQYLQTWYSMVQEANQYMQTQAPWVKFKDESTKADGIADLQYLLWMIKQLTLLSAPFLTNSFKKVQEIL